MVHGNRIVWQGVGTLILGEVVTSYESWVITPIRIQLGSPIEGWGLLGRFVLAAPLSPFRVPTTPMKNNSGTLCRSIECTRWVARAPRVQEAASRPARIDLSQSVQITSNLSRLLVQCAGWA